MAGADLNGLSLPPAPDPAKDANAYLRSIYAVRAQAKLVYEKAQQDELHHFRLHWDKFDDVTQFVVRIIKRDFGDDFTRIPPHGRWQHFEVGDKPRVKILLDSFGASVDAHEQARRLIDLFLVSVLLDAGAGNQWSYQSSDDGHTYTRSEGIAIATFDMFTSGFFSSDAAQPWQVDGDGLERITSEALESSFQVSSSNPMDGIEGRRTLLNQLAKALRNKEYFGTTARPGNLLDYVLQHPTTEKSTSPFVQLPILWDALQDGLIPIWPTRHLLDGKPLGDCWPLSSLLSDGTVANEQTNHDSTEWKGMMPFHKLTQWLTYSLVPIFTRLLNATVSGQSLMTGLPEYRNGGLFLDLGVLSLRYADAERGLRNYQINAGREGQPRQEVVPLFEASDEVIVEWRAITLGLLDRLGEDVNAALGLTEDKKLSLAQVLEAGSWKGGREIAAVCRPNTRGPPIMILSDGTVF